MQIAVVWVEVIHKTQHQEARAKAEVVADTSRTVISAEATTAVVVVVAMAAEVAAMDTNPEAAMAVAVVTTAHQVVVAMVSKTLLQVVPLAVVKDSIKTMAVEVAVVVEWDLKCVGATQWEVVVAYTGEKAMNSRVPAAEEVNVDVVVVVVATKAVKTAVSRAREEPLVALRTTRR